jgi:hypothetical protein
MTFEMTLQRVRTADPDEVANPLPFYAARDDVRTEPGPVRFVIIAIAVMFLTVFVVLPLVVVFAQAFSKGIGASFSALSDPEASHFADRSAVLGQPGDCRPCFRAAVRRAGLLGAVAAKP